MTAMSALGQKRTLFTASLYVRFAPESGHLSAQVPRPLSANSEHCVHPWKFSLLVANCTDVRKA
jgi:hypothetical protein